MNAPADTRNRLGRAADIAFLLGCLVLAGIVATRYFGQPSETPVVPSSSGARVETERLGATLPPWRFLDDGQPSRILLVFVRSECRFCTASMPFYRELAAAASAVETRFVVISSDTVPVTAAYLREHELTVDAIEQLIDPSPLSVSGTPTLIVADRRHRVLGSWLGRLSPVQETSVKELLAQ